MKKKEQAASQDDAMLDDSQRDVDDDMLDGLAEETMTSANKNSER